MSSSSTSPEQNSTEMPKRPISDVLSETFPSFDHHAKIVSPFDEETKRDAEFVEKLNTMLLELIIEFHAWSAARPTFESERTADALEKEVKALVEAEKEQGRSSASLSTSTSSASQSLVEKTRQRLHDFITRIKLALVALTTLAP
ncbi:hypothetical protein L227DRAFT_610295 [Lentinus tigrinus ALCF2SS1-6]|uniref:Uncharacterized protein n=1 Tax=Lentinus tigrinus ALCF2SS1-6 TaxID=1328759 RepID=A0A5C2SD94_9APHY|nr:hypothetical protein L227DRAFT_610295 [Lentinus tigrinus ALCF2SS1-6]